MDLRRLLHPRSIAVVGATDRPGSYSGQAIINLDTFGFTGKLWGVNPTRTQVLGHECVPTLADLPEAPDAVVVAVPAAGVPELIEQAGALGCGGAVVFSAGFGEVAEGVALQAELVAAAQRYHLPVCGPNGNGIVAVRARAPMWGDSVAPREPGHVGLISQSGNLAVNALATRRGLRLHTVISGGNQSVLTAADYLEALVHEEDLRSVALYLEDDGGPRLCEALAVCTEAGVRVVVLKAGNSVEGQRTVAAHSGSLAGDQRVFRALLRDAGALLADDPHELLEIAKTLAAVRPAGLQPAGVRPAGVQVSAASAVGPERPAAAPLESSAAAVATSGVAILTCSGGDSALGADQAAHRGIALPQFESQTAQRLRELLPAAATVANPLDYTAMLWGDVDALAELVQIVASDPGIEQVLVFYDQPDDLGPDAEQSWAAVREGVTLGASRVQEPVIVASTLPELLDDDAAWEFACNGIAPVAGLQAGLICAQALRTTPPDPERARAIAAAAAAVSGRGSDPGWLSEHDAKQLLREAGIAVPDGYLVRTEDEAAAALTELGTPLVLKLSSSTVQHKTELGGVALGLSSEADARAAYRQLAPLAIEHRGELLIERMAAAGTELLVAARADTIVPVLVIGLGGIWTELLDDVAIVPLPASAAEIERGLRSLRGAPMFTGGRGRPPADLTAAAALIERCGELLLTRPLELIELNPVFVSEHGAVAVDATVRTASTASTNVVADDAALPQPTPLT